MLTISVFTANILFSEDAKAGVHPAKRMTTAEKILNEMIFLFMCFLSM